MTGEGGQLPDARGYNTRGGISPLPTYPLGLDRSGVVPPLSECPLVVPGERPPRPAEDLPLREAGCGEEALPPVRVPPDAYLKGERFAPLWGARAELRDPPEL